MLNDERISAGEFQFLSRDVNRVFKFSKSGLQMSHHTITPHLHMSQDDQIPNHQIPMSQDDQIPNHQIPMSPDDQISRSTDIFPGH